MAYAKISNLYRPEAQAILLFKWVWALEKIHGTSAHVAFKGGRLSFFAGGEKHDNFVKLFNVDALQEAFAADFTPLQEVVVHGEAYGGKCQGMSKVYGPQLRFDVFDIRVDGDWLTVPKAELLAQRLGFSFVPYSQVSTDLELLDAERDAPSYVAGRNGTADGAVYDCSKREGVVLRPPIEVRTNDGNRICAKHKRAEFCERKTQQEVNESKRVVLSEAQAVADEWVTPMRLTHVLDKLGRPVGYEFIPAITAAMVVDVMTEASGEIVDSKDARRAISTKTVQLYKQHLAATGAYDE